MGRNEEFMNQALKPDVVDISDGKSTKKSTAWLHEICAARKAKLIDMFLPEEMGPNNSYIFRSKWTVYWGERVFEITGPGAPTKKAAKLLASTMVLIEWGVTPNFLATHNKGLLKELPLLCPEYVPPQGPGAQENCGVQNSATESQPGPPSPCEKNASVEEEQEVETQKKTNAVVQLRELCEKLGFQMPEIKPDVTRQCGPSHRPTFTFVCRIVSEDKTLTYEVEVTKTGSNKQEMKQLAAEKMLYKLEIVQNEALYEESLRSMNPEAKPASSASSSISASILKAANLKHGYRKSVEMCTVKRCAQLVSHKNHVFIKIFRKHLCPELRKQAVKVAEDEEELVVAPAILAAILDGIPNSSVQYYQIPKAVQGVACTLVEVYFQEENFTHHGISNTYTDSRCIAALEVLHFILEMSQPEPEEDDDMDL